MTPLTKKRIVMHKQPDVDALVSVWLEERYLFSGHTVKVEFLDYAVDVEQLPGVDCVVDLGGVSKTPAVRPQPQASPSSVPTLPHSSRQRGRVSGLNGRRGPHLATAQRSLFRQSSS